MIRITKALAVAAVVVMTLPSIASALGISIVNVSGAGAGGTLNPGETVTFDLVMENNTNESLFGVGADVTGYDTPDLFGTADGNLVLQGGTVAGAAFGVNAGGTIFNSLGNLLSAPVENFFVSQFDPQALTTSLFAGVATSGSTGTGADDIGIGGNTVGSGDIHFQVTFVALASPGAGLGSTANITLNFDLEAFTAGGASVSSSGDFFNLTVIPEPGTALLMGLGLAGLAGSGRRR